MAEAAATADHPNIYFLRFPPHQESDHPQAAYAFIVAVMINLVQIMYQGKSESPFITRPKTMFLLIATLLLHHCFSYDFANVNVRSTRISAAASYFGKIVLRFCRPLSLASVTSILLPESLSPLVFSLSLLFPFSQLLLSYPSQVERGWDMVKKASGFIKDKFRGGRDLPDNPTSTSTSNGIGI